MSKPGLVLEGKKNAGKSGTRHLGLGMPIAIIGFVICVISLMMGGSEAREVFGKNGEIITFAMGMIGAVMIILGIATPFLAMYQAKKCFIDVYETYVTGSYVLREKGKVDQYISFQFPYEKINSVSSGKNKVFLHTSSGTYECMAMNAEEIKGAIQMRLH